ncbi:hypothetical protein [Thermomonas alba]|uniref:hypothetical protein n=1 Tax=Thermomonas alba TaxID=2888525 RepID=UPI001F03622E|nr:hypothetical protein [Thermomonas alba]
MRVSCVPMARCHCSLTQACPFPERKPSKPRHFANTREPVKHQKECLYYFFDISNANRIKSRASRRRGMRARRAQSNVQGVFFAAQHFFCDDALRQFVTKITVKRHHSTRITPVT